VALEMARQLEASGRRPSLLIVIDTALPGHARRARWAWLRAPRAAWRQAVGGMRLRLANLYVRLWVGAGGVVPLRWRRFYTGYWCARLERAYRPQAYGDPLAALLRPALAGRRAEGS
jgi:hypothetical protein